MHILFLSDNFPPETNAPATRLAEHARHWVAQGARVTVVTCAPNFPHGKVHGGYRNRWYQREVVDGIEVVRVKTFISANQGFALRILDYLSFMVAGFVAGLFQRRPDVVVGTSPQFFAAVGAWALAFVRRKPFVMELRDLWPASITAVGAMERGPLIRLLESLEMFLYRRARRIISVTESFRTELIERGIEGSKIDVVRNGVDLTQYSPRPRDEVRARAWGLEGKFVLGYLGTHGMAHGLEHVLDAAEELRDHDRIRFLLVGAGAERAGLMEQARQRGLDNVVFQEPVPKEEMPSVWSLCDVSLIHLRNLPLFETVIPSKLFEAMGMGIPVLYVAPPGEASGLVEDSGCGLALQSGDPGALAEAAVGLATDPARLGAFSNRSLEAAPCFDRARGAHAMLSSLKCASGLDDPIGSKVGTPGVASEGEVRNTFAPGVVGVDHPSPALPFDPEDTEIHGNALESSVTSPPR